MGIVWVFASYEPVLFHILFLLKYTGSLLKSEQNYGLIFGLEIDLLYKTSDDQKHNL